jgi:outer membrane protein assembly factor BamB
VTTISSVIVWKIRRFDSISISQILVVLFCFLQPSYASETLDVKLLWKTNVDMVLEGAPMVVDLNGDGDAEILTAAYEHIIVVDGTGEELWRFDTRGRYSTCPAILERDNQLPLIYAGDNQGLFTCLDGSGKIVWQAETAPIFSASPALADLDADGKIEVIQGDKTGGVSVYDALTGELVWCQKIDKECSSPAVGDLNGDGQLEIIIAATSGNVFALSSKGEKLWEFNVGSTSLDWSTCSPILFQNSKGQVCIAAGSQDGRFFCLDNQGKILWQHTTRGAIGSTISAGDFNSDGRADLFAVTQLGVLYRFDENGRILWDIDTQGRSLASGALFDVDGDGVQEYVLSTQRGNLLIFDNAGKVVFNYQFDNRTINVTPAFGDIVKDRPGLEMAFTGGEGSKFYCMGIPALVEKTQWRTYRSDNRLTAAWFGLASSNAVQMIPENLQWDQIFTGSEISFKVENPGSQHKKLKAEAHYVRPDGSRQAAVGQIIGKRGLLKLPVTVTAPGIYQFNWSLSGPLEKLLTTGSRQLTLLPYANDQALAKQAGLALQEMIEMPGNDPSSSGLKKMLSQETLAITKEATKLTSLQAAAPGAFPEFSEKLNKRTAALNERSNRALALAEITESILKKAPESQLVAFEGITWENRDVDLQLPSEISIPMQIQRRCIVGEHEPVSIKLMNVTLDSLLVSCKVKKNSGSPIVTAFQVKPVATNQNTIAWDPIEPLGKQKMIIPPLKAREVWLDIDLADVNPGVHDLAVTFDTGKTKTNVNISLNVLPFKMAGFEKMRLCCWSSYNKDAVRDLLAHGNTVFTRPLPPVKIESEEPFQLGIDFSALDEFISPMKGHDVYLLMPSIPDLGVPMEEAAYVSRLSQYLNQVMQHLAERGIPENRIALYPHDEPGGQGWDTVNHYIAFARQGVKARPGLQFYVNGGGDVAMFEALNEFATIWCPGYFMLPDDAPLNRYLEKSGKTFWTYDCGYNYARPVGANTKTINVVAQYRLPALFANHYGVTGIGYWCYNVGPSMWDTIKLEYPLVYKNKDDSYSSSRRWEAVRESVEDARILIALRQKLDDPAVSEAAKTRVRHLVEVTLPDIAEQSLNEVKLGVARYVIDASNNDATVEKLRQEIMDCVSLLAQ